MYYKGYGAYQVGSYDDARLTLTYLTSWSKIAFQCNLIGIIFKNSFIAIKAKVIILTRFGYPNKTSTIDKYLRSRLTFHLSVKVTHVGLPSVYLNTLFLVATRPIELEFYI